MEQVEFYEAHEDLAALEEDYEEMRVETAEGEGDKKELNELFQPLADLN
jgi:hypothetical protein